MIDAIFQANITTAPGLYWTSFCDGTGLAIREWTGTEWLVMGQTEPEPAEFIMLVSGLLEAP